MARKDDNSSISRYDEAEEILSLSLSLSLSLVKIDDRYT
jgi:hypothetical protein